jgi:hypothetical protein
MSPVNVLTSCAHAVPVCNDTGGTPFLTGDNAWIGMPVIAVVIVVVVIVVRLRRRKG